MSKAHHVIYVPGLGDHRTYGQRTVMRLWRLLGVQGHFHPVGWANGEAFGPKLERILAQIDALLEQGNDVSLLGASAGASAVLNALAARRDNIVGVALICGKVHRPENMHPSIYQRNPAFKDAMEMLAKTLPTLTTEDRTQILSLHPLTDMTVPVKDTIIEGAHKKTMLVVGHSIGIAYGLTIGAAGIVRFLKRQA